MMMVSPELEITVYYDNEQDLEDVKSYIERCQFGRWRED